MKLSYRPEIDGLRTIAVLSVIFYHAQILLFGRDFFKGGFVGVDIFFVISGYLISRILLSELFEKGKISFLQFYERRARRILPILFTVFLSSFLLAYKYSYILPNQLIEFAHSILSATFFGSNIFFYFTNIQYGAEDSLLQPFLHTWSLGVEEQFYILFPILLLIAYRFAKNHLVTIITVLILISLTYADWESTKNIQLNFFMLTSRLWELAIGSLLAFNELKYGRVNNELLKQTMPLLGLAMIAYSIIFFNNQTPHPSLITLLPTLGTALIILYSGNKTDLVSKVLSLRPIVGIGLISYSMYLWHYPLFALARASDLNGVSHDEKYLLILLTLFLSVISYYFIERPFRNKIIFTTRLFTSFILIMFIFIIGLCANIYLNKGYEERLPSLFHKDRSIFTEHLWNKLKINGIPCYGRKDNFCEIGNEHKGVINIVGDSHLASLQSDLVERLKNDYKIVTLTQGGCWLLEDSVRFEKINIVDKNCDDIYQKRRIEYIKQNPKSIIILGGRINNVLSQYISDKHNQVNGNINFEKPFFKIKGQDSIEENIKRSILKLLNYGHSIVLIYPVVEFESHVSKELLKNLPKDINQVNNWLNLQDNWIKTDYEEYLSKSYKSFKLLDSIEHKNLHRVYPHELFCDNYIKEKCIAHNEDNLFYSDSNHVSSEGAKIINNLVIKKIRDIENKAEL